MTVYSNPRMSATIENWPSGSYRVTANFTIEQHEKRGERAVRTTIDPWSKRPRSPKQLTYAKKARLVDGDDGRLYIAELRPYSGAIAFIRGTMDYYAEDAIPETDPRHAELLKLFEEVA